MTTSLARLGIAFALCLAACAPGVLDDSGDLRGSDEALRKAEGWAESDAEFHVPGECPHAETLPASAQKLARNENGNNCTGCASNTQCRTCHTSDDATGVVTVRTFATATQPPQGNCEQCHTSGASGFKVALHTGSGPRMCGGCHESRNPDSSVVALPRTLD